MPLTKSELLIPRVLCIGTKDGEPNDTSGDFITGDILTQTVKSIHKWKSEKLKHSVYLDPDFIAKFHHLFRRLAWCDYRDDKIEVDYVRYIKTGIVLPASHTVYNGKTFFIGPSKKYEPGIRFEPADESDYQEYQKQKQ